MTFSVVNQYTWRQQQQVVNNKHRVCRFGFFLKKAQVKIIENL